MNAVTELGGRILFSYFSTIFLPANFNKFAESKCFFLGNIALVLKLPLITSAEVPGSTPDHG